MAGLDNSVLEDANAILLNFFGPGAFSESMRWANTEREAADEAKADAASAAPASEDDDLSFPDEK